jgi:hypothetical protein
MDHHCGADGSDGTGPSRGVEFAYGATPEKMSQFCFTFKGFGEASNHRLMVSMKYPNAKELQEKCNAGLKKIKTSGE